MMVMGRLAGDERVTTRRQIEPLHCAELCQDLQRPEDRGAPEPASAALRLAEQLLGGEVARPRGDEAGKRSPGRGQPVPGALEGFDDGLGGNHAPMLAVIETQSQ